MGLLGKILAILNVLAAIGFLAVAVMDYGKQRAWSTLVFQEDLLRDGLPLDDTEKDFNGEVISKKIGTYTLQQLLTGGQPVTTQVAEVRQRQSALNDAINQAGGEPEQRAKMAEILLPIATSFGDREEMKRRIAKEPMDQLQGEDGPFKTAFREAIEGKADPKIKGPGVDQAAPHALSAELRRQAIAHLLFNLGDKPQNYDQRLQGVIGMKAFLQEAVNQLAVNKELLDAYELAIRKESQPFELNHRELLAQILASAERLQDQRAVLQKQEENRDVHNSLVAKRKQAIEAMLAQIDGAQKHLDATLRNKKS